MSPAQLQQALALIDDELNKTKSDAPPPCASTERRGHALASNAPKKPQTGHGPRPQPKLAEGHVVIAHDAVQEVPWGCRWNTLSQEGRLDRACLLRLLACHPAPWARLGCMAHTRASKGRGGKPASGPGGLEVRLTRATAALRREFEKARHRIAQLKGQGSVAYDALWEEVGTGEIRRWIGEIRHPLLPRPRLSGEWRAA